IAAGQNASCPGWMVLPPLETQKAPRDPHAKCPAEQRYVVAIALPRVGRAHLPNGHAYDREKGAAEGYSAARVIGTVLDPSGSSVTVYDFVLKKEESGWKFIEAVALFIAE